MKTLLYWLWLLGVNYLAGRYIWEYNPRLFWALFSSASGLAPLFLVLNAKAERRKANAEIEASWHRTLDRIETHEAYEAHREQL